jgi:hypothetical protein
LGGDKIMTQGVPGQAPGGSFVSGEFGVISLDPNFVFRFKSGQQMQEYGRGG